MLEIPIHANDWLLARQASAAHFANVAKFGFNDTIEKDRPYFTSAEKAELGYVAQIAFGRYLGIDHDPSANMSDGIGEQADVRGYEVKCSPWRRSSHEDIVEGGYIWVPERTKAAVIVRISMYESTWRNRAFFNGWIRKSEIFGYSSGGHKRSRQVPMAALHEPSTLPVV